jgi:hypothetical protein
MSHPKTISPCKSSDRVHNDVNINKTNKPEGLLRHGMIININMVMLVIKRVLKTASAIKKRVPSHTKVVLN